MMTMQMTQDSMALFSPIGDFSLNIPGEKRLWISVLKQFLKDLRSALHNQNEITKKVSKDYQRKTLHKTLNKIEKHSLALYRLRREADHEHFGKICMFIGVNHEKFVEDVDKFINRTKTMEQLDKIINELD